MKCRVCGSALHATTTDLPFKVSNRTIVILKQLPVEQCGVCARRGAPFHGQHIGRVGGHSIRGLSACLPKVSQTAQSGHARWCSRDAEQTGPTSR